MEKEKMLSIVNKLNLYLAISEVHGFVQFWQSSADSFSVHFTHFDERYPYDNKTLFIYDWQSDEEIESLVNKAKEVIARGGVLND
ncbi:hypothetical protein DWS95_09115 [Staphylococcus pseudintermedius]|uniref:Uncharacterized protein n=1 Tax=Staphylococcus pseudintermedius TaxID=283734 RepID=A0A3D8Z8Y0_STAPS|nr:hypothetical protein [Staphylococcus pseudintermedius]EGQ1589053.1 hypothetical protein [Staphylococcus pseudintermedius]EGQ1677259.1 hypothetical protein [Staphylococcus pseudintermedius]EGQ3173987.1 hypothetical protein [Staphylococcus pseudintermedius]EGQ3240724.1 hypothetical protein [Staphylococcus pseudintermedius]EGQ3245625.1 hypothetical protein [Staphylococcus pseudintermedius]